MKQPIVPGSDERSQAKPAGVIHAFIVHPLRLTRYLMLGILALIVLHLVFSINGLFVGYEFPGATFLFVLFDLHGEVTIPTWYSSMLLLLCAMVLGAITLIKRRAGDRFRHHWLGLAIIFVGLSAEESADVHGAVSVKLQNAFETSGALAYPWVIPAAILTMLVGLAYVSFLRDLEPTYRFWFMLAGAIFVGAALGMEVVQAAWDSSRGDGWEYFVLVTIEESLEMIGAGIFFAATLSYLGSITRHIHLEVMTR